MHTINDKIKKREKANDIFYTPLNLVKKHLEIVQPFVKTNDIILDPFYGSGNYFNLYKDYFKKNNTFEWCEIEKEKDFFTYNTNVNIIVSNPPYSILDKVLEQSIKLKPRIISYLIGINNLTTKRIEYMNEKGYKLVNIHLCKVFKWFGMSSIVTFSINGENVINYDRVIYRC
jgi:type I restriction-modification system DNA methylase subunit